MWHDAPRREYLNLHDAERRATFPADVGPGRDRNISNSLKKDYMKLMKSNDLLATQITDLRPMPRAQFFSKTFDIPRASQKTYCFWCLKMEWQIIVWIRYLFVQRASTKKVGQGFLRPCPTSKMENPNDS
jgi:hypothetical protein